MENLLNGLAVALQAQNIVYCFLGCLVGTLVGVLPGIGPTGALALLLPITFQFDPIGAVIMMSGIAYGAQYGSSTTAILVNLPGEASSVITCLDGYEMARQGRAGPALGIAAMGSFIAGTVSVVGLMFLAPVLSRAALAFDSPEYFAMMVTSLVLVTYLVRGSMIKGLIMVCLGLFIATVGVDGLSGRARFTYGLISLQDGVGLIPFVIGLFGVSDILATLSARVKPEVISNIRAYLPTLQDWKDSGGAITRGSLLGFLMGILPGMSLMVPTFLSYSIEKRLSKHPEKFGTGVVEGVAGPESANNAAAVGTFVPLLSLGIPSNAFNAVLLGALMIYGMQPGPMLIKSHPDLFYGVVASMYLGNVMLVILNLPLIPLWVRVLKIPVNLLSVLILIFCFLGTYSINGNTSDVVITFAFGVLGYVLKRLQFETPPLILAYVLGPLIDVNFRQAMIISDGSMQVFMQRPVSVVLLLVGLVIVVTSFIRKRSFSTAVTNEN